MTYARPVVVSIRGLTVLFTLAEREGFEPPLQFPVIQFSRLTQSTTLPSLRIWVTNGNRTHGTRYHKPLLYQLSYSHHLKGSGWLHQESRLIRLHTPLESWVLLLILSVYPCVTSLHAYQPTPFTTNCSQERNWTSLQGATRHPWPAIGLEPTLYPTWL
jgi:hypothetical protein